MVWLDEFAEMGPNMPNVKIKSRDITYNLIQQAIERVAAEYLLPVSFRMDEIKVPFSGKATGSCLMLCHPDHLSDYYSFCITMNTQGIVTYIQIRAYGNSKLTDLKNKRDQRISSRKLTDRLLSTLIEVDDSEYNAEYAYYDALQDVIMEAFA